MSLSEQKRLLVSKSGKSMGTLKTWFFCLLGCYLVGSGAWRLYNGVPFKTVIHSLLIGTACLLVMRYKKLLYVSPEGFVKETHTWFTHHREMLRWEEVQFITMMYRREEVMVFVERDVLGWKMMFESSQSEDLKDLFDEFIPDIEVNEIQR